VAAGCGGPGNEDLFQQPGAGGSGKGSAGAGAMANGGSSASGGSGGSSTGGSSMGGSSNGGSSGSGTGGNGTGGMNTGGSTGGMNTGGSTGGMNTGGSTGGMSTGGSPASGGTGGMSTGGSPASGGTGGMSTGGSPASGGTGGGLAGLGGSGGEPNCDALAEQYQKALQAAQVCSPEIDRPQCTVQVQSSVPCGCPVWANVDNEEELAALERLAQQAERCIMICPAVLCVEPGSGICSSSGSGDAGHCESAINSTEK